MSPITDASTTISRSSSLDKKGDSMSANNVLSYDVFVSDPIPQNVTGLLPNGETHMFSPLSTTLIYGKNDAVLVDPPLTTDQAKAVGDWVETPASSVWGPFPKSVWTMSPQDQELRSIGFTSSAP
jgi:hypothetical protein